MLVEASVLSCRPLEVLTVPKQRPIDERIAELEVKLRALKQRKRVEVELQRLKEMTPRTKRRAKRA